MHCCLIKRLYHIKGKIEIIGNSIRDKFTISFSADPNLDGPICSFIENEIIFKKKNLHICLGSDFPCLQKEFNHKTLIKSKNILFIIVRIYHRKISGIEIFTYKPFKSYYFNFREIIDINNIKKTNNIVIDEFNKNENFKLIEKDNITLYFNKYYKSVIFPLIKEREIKLYEMSNYCNNYDLLTFVNLLSNRSFKDIYQYPVFPALCKPIAMIIEKDDQKKKKLEEKRVLSMHVGLNEINTQSKNRKDGFISDYYASLSEGEEDCYLFRLFYSTSIFVSLYLARVIPFCFLAIENQGDGFDNPNRQFFSINVATKNLFQDRSDLREFIPELYYLPELYMNKNEIYFGEIKRDNIKTEINNVFITEQNEDKFCKFEYITNLKNEIEFDNSIKLQNWINLIFGINQKVYNYKNEEINYYQKDLYLDKNEFNDINKKLKFQENYKIDDATTLKLNKYQLGISPIEIYDKTLENLYDKSEYFENIKLFNMKKFEVENLSFDNNNCDDKYKCYECRSSDIINGYYYYIINKKKKTELSNFDKNLEKYHKEFISYLNTKAKNTSICFEGNYLGNVTIIIEGTEKKKCILKDHNKMIKFIDYNKRLNAFLSYSLDGYINIYTFPKYKLVRAIEVSKFSKNELNIVALVSNPFPMIFAYDSYSIYILTINGDLIKAKTIETIYSELEIKFEDEKNKKDIEVIPCIDKDFGIVNDSVFIIGQYDKQKKYIEIELPSLEPKIWGKEGKKIYCNCLLI